MHHPFRDAFAVETLELLNQMRILKNYRTFLPCRL